MILNCIAIVAGSCEVVFAIRRPTGWPSQVCGGLGVVLVALGLAGLLS